MFKPKVPNILRSLQNGRSSPTLVPTVISAGHQTTSLMIFMTDRFGSVQTLLNEPCCRPLIGLSECGMAGSRRSTRESCYT